MEKMLYPKSPIVTGHRRPESSDAGAHIIGPAANPRTYSVTPSVETSVLTPNSWLTCEVVDEKIELQKEATKVEYAMMAAMATLGFVNCRAITCQQTNGLTSFPMASYVDA